VSLTKRKSYYTTAKVLHWTVAFVAALLLMSGWQAEDLALDNKLVFMMVHSGLGSLVFVLILIRWWWRRKHKLYSRPQWYKKPSMLVQWLFYPLLLLQPVIGILQAAFTEYDVRAFGLINYSAVAVKNEAVFNIFHKLHAIIATLLLLILFIHIIDRSRKFFIEDSQHL
jgi:cytochrome b561